MIGYIIAYISHKVSLLTTVYILNKKQNGGRPLRMPVNLIYFIIFFSHYTHWCLV